jgi:hypothetical protein
VSDPENRYGRHRDQGHYRRRDDVFHGSPGGGLVGEQMIETHFRHS